MEVKDPARGAWWLVSIQLIDFVIIEYWGCHLVIVLDTDFPLFASLHDNNQALSLWVIGEAEIIRGNHIYKKYKIKD